MEPLVTSAIIGAIGTGASSLLNYGSSYWQNIKDAKFAERMYERQLADSRENWRMQQEYDLPENVMKRYTDAGLNPHLIYGQGASAGVANSSPGNVSAMNWHQQAPQIDTQAVNAISTYYQLQGMKLANQNAEKEIEKKDSEIRSIEQETVNKRRDQRIKEWTELQAKWNYEFNESTRQLKIDLMQGNLDKLSADIDAVYRTQRRADAINDSQLATMAQARQVQIEQLNISKQELGARVRLWNRQGIAALKQAAAAQQNAATNAGTLKMLEERNSRLNQLTDAQVGETYLKILNLVKDGHIKDAEYLSRKYGIYGQRIDLYDKKVGLTRSLAGERNSALEELGGIVDLITGPFDSNGSFRYGDLPNYGDLP